MHHRLALGLIAALSLLLAACGSTADPDAVIETDAGMGRVGVQSAIAHPDTAALIRKLMAARGMKVPPGPKTSACITQVCQ